MFTIHKNFTNYIRGDFRPDLGGWQYHEERDEKFPYNAYMVSHTVGAGNFRRIQMILCVDNMLSAYSVKDKK